MKPLFVAKYLWENSDKDHPVKVHGSPENKEENSIIFYLQDECGIEADRRSVYRDIAALRDVFGLDIEGGQGGRFRLASRPFEYEDLRLLAASVHAAKFISASKASELIHTIGEFGSKYQAQDLTAEVFSIDRVRTTQKGVLMTISKLNRAMAKKIDGKPHTPQQISFRYLTYTIKDIQTPVEQKTKYTVSPHRLIMNDGNYYLLAYNAARKDIFTFRIDRMKSVELLDAAAEGGELFDNLDIENYTKQRFGMFSGEKKRIQIRFINRLLNTAIERFGTGNDTHYFPDGKGHFIVATDVYISDQFFSWVCGFRKGADIVSPPEVREQMKSFLADIYAYYDE